MKTILAALDNSVASRSVLASAQALSTILDSHVEAVHVQTNGHHAVRDMTDATGIALRTTTGSVVDRLVEAGEGARRRGACDRASITPASPRPLVGTATAVAVALRKPVLSVVPPDAEPPPAFRRVLVRLEGFLSTSIAPRSVRSRKRRAYRRRRTAHPREDSSPLSPISPNTRCRHGLGSSFTAIALGASEMSSSRRGSEIGELVPIVAEQCSCDLIALGWSQQLAPGRAPVVQETLQRSHLPVLLVPVGLAYPRGGARLAGGDHMSPLTTLS